MNYILLRNKKKKKKKREYLSPQYLLTLEVKVNIDLASYIRKKVRNFFVLLQKIP